MKKYLLSISSFLFASSVFAQQGQISNKPVLCTDFNTAVNIAANKNEYPILNGDAVLRSGQGQIPAKIVITYNKDNKTFSIFEFYNPNYVCLLGSGANFSALEDEERTFEPSDKNTDNETEKDIFEQLGILPPKKEDFL